MENNKAKNNFIPPPQTSTQCTQMILFMSKITAQKAFWITVHMYANLHWTQSNKAKANSQSSLKRNETAVTLIVPEALSHFRNNINEKNILLYFFQHHDSFCIHQICFLFLQKWSHSQNLSSSKTRTQFL